MSDLKARLQHDLAEARKARDKARTLVLSTTLSEIRNREIDMGGEAGDGEVLEVITKAIKQRRDSAEQMAAGGRPDLADKESAEAELLKGYLPEQLSADEVRGMIREIVAGGATAMGPVMGQLVPRIKGRFDGKEANALVREALEG
ncbi:MAG TPA: GatB/YqeY domain-containing protein [Longimicrobiales bacterium]|nr:GatB/YqeY domain-containing protein [Longimicrobiales bacterium]